MINKIQKNSRLIITSGIHRSPFGWCLVGVTKNTICYFSFIENNKEDHLAQIKKVWPHAEITRNDNVTSKVVKQILNSQNIPIVASGTDFQVKIWNTLLKIPPGKTLSYREVAEKAGSAKAARAVGTACGKNPIALLIPCHRVVTSDGKLGGYRWGIKLKKEIQLAELSQ